MLANIWQPSQCGWVYQLHDCCTGIFNQSHAITKHLQEKRVEFEAAIATQREELQHEVDAKRTAWDEEKRTHEVQGSAACLPLLRDPSGTSFLGVHRFDPGTSRLASAPTAGLPFSQVNPPFINAEEKIDKVVGRRTRQPDPFKSGMQLQSLAVELHRSLGHRWAAKGVYRFNTHNEADAWMNRMLARSQTQKS